MVWLHIMFNNRRRSLISAALAAVFLLLAGGANALAITVWTVSKSSSVAACSAPTATTCNNISSAVGVASPGDAIIVGPGTYNESVTIITPALSLLGAQAGNDARVGRHDPTKESIVNATGTGYPAFWIEANYVVIDGFTLRGGTGSTGNPPGGVFVGAAGTGYYWAQVLNNIIEKNGPGVLLYKAPSSPPPAPPPSALIEHNLFRDNNYGTGTWKGFGIVVQNGALPPVITENAFTGNKMTAMVFVGSGDVTVTNNTSENDGAFVFFVGTNRCLFSHNHGKDFGRKGVLPLVIGPNTIYADAAVDIGPGNLNLMISDNVLENGEAPIDNGIAFTTAFAASPYGTTPNSIVNVKNNRIVGFPGNGIVAEEESGTGTLQGSWIVGNEVWNNGSDGIFIDANNLNISFFDNQAEGNHTLDCNDASTGYGTLGTANGWFNNIGNFSYPTGLCSPGRGHYRD